MTSLETCIKEVIEKGGWDYNPTVEKWKALTRTTDGSYRTMADEFVLLQPSFWQSLARARGWSDSKYRACTMKMPFYAREKMRGTGIITGESRDGNCWYVRWDRTAAGKQTKKGGMRLAYPKENIDDKSKDKNWIMVWHRFIDHLAEGKDAESFFAAL
jgi:hypothetical protein